MKIHILGLCQAWGTVESI